MHTGKRLPTGWYCEHVLPSYWMSRWTLSKRAGDDLFGVARATVYRAIDRDARRQDPGAMGLQ